VNTRDVANTIALPIALFSVIAPSATFLSPYFTTTTRWVGVTLLFGTVILNRDWLRNSWRSYGTIPIVAYLAWTLMTGFWSAVPQLTIMKGIAAVLSLTALYHGGIIWARSRPLFNAFDFILPIFLVVLVGSIAGLQDPDAYDSGRRQTMYRGLFSHQNTLGVMIAICITWPLWQAYTSRHSPIRTGFWLTFTLLLMYALVLTHARSAMLMAASTCLGAIQATGPRLRSQILSCIGAVLLCVAIISPSTLTDAVYKTIYKWDDNNVLSSRADPWRKSQIGAEAGGLTGLGFGVSLGYDTFAGGVTAIGYGREKGNSQLAIAEELGLIGLVLYAAIILSIGRTVLEVYRRARSREQRALAGLLGGTLAGLVAQSCLEGWWTSPGSVEFAFFWVIAGVMSGQRLTLTEATGTKTRSRHASGRLVPT